MDRQRSHGAAGNIEDSIFLCHALVEKAISAGNVAIANNLLVTIGKLAKEHEQAQIRQGLLLDKQTVCRAAMRVAEVFTEGFRAVLEEAEFNRIINDILPRIIPAIEQVVSERKQPIALLTHEEEQP